MAEFLRTLWPALIVVGSMLGVINILALTLIYLERKVAARFQCRVGPMRVGWHGVLQPVADGIKLLFKESPTPAGADKLLFTLAPIIPCMASFAMLALLPLPIQSTLADLNTGVLFLIAVSSVGVIGLLFAGWGSNNKYSLLGGMRAGAQIVSYELSAALAVLVIVFFSGSLRFADIIESQRAGWWIWRAHIPAILAFIAFTISSTAECNRAPFDLVEGESELTAGFHTEYAGIRFAVFFFAEFINVFILCAVSATLFFGGWLPLQIPGSAAWITALNAWLAAVPGAVWFAGKSMALVFVMMWFRWTIPRLRIDQLMRLEWKLLLPLGLANAALAAVVVVTRLYFYP